MKPLALALLLALAVLTGCSESKLVVLQATKDGKRLTYDCDHFQPQVETPEDIGILVAAARDTFSDASTNGAMITMTEIDEALSKDDWRRLERAVVAPTEKNNSLARLPGPLSGHSPRKSLQT